MDGTGTPAVEHRAMRADARRNYGRLLAAADAAFTEHGAEASLEDIARRAGVGIGTLYRHFPTRMALLEAVYLDRVRVLCARADELRQTRSAGDALDGWLRALAAHRRPGWCAPTSSRPSCSSWCTLSSWPASTRPTTPPRSTGCSRSCWTACGTPSQPAGKPGSAG